MNLIKCWIGVCLFRMFYLFFESRNKKDAPLVIWLTGGPGCSSELAMFYENGPFKLNNNMSLTWNEYGWDQVLTFISMIPVIYLITGPRLCS